MNSSDFSDGYDGYCCTSEVDGREFILSQCFIEGTHGVGEAVRSIIHQFKTIPTIGFRFSMLQRGIEMEQRGMRLTSKTPAASAIVKREFGIRKGMSKVKTAAALGFLLTLASMVMEEEREEE